MSRQLYASWTGAPGALAYEAQISYDAGGTYTSLWQGGSTSFSANVSSAEAYLRVRAIGRLAGPWVTVHLPAIILEVIDPTLQQKIDAFNARIRAEVTQQFEDFDKLFKHLEHWQVVNMDLLAGWTMQFQDQWQVTDQIRQTLQIGVDIANASITTEQNVRASADSAMAQQITTVQASVNTVSASVTNETTARVQGDQALAAQTSSLAVRMTNAEGSIQTEAQVRANQDNVFAGQIATIQTTQNGQQATLQTYGTSINGLMVQYGVVGTISGYSGGFIFTGIKRNDGAVAYGIEFNVDYFRVSGPGGAYGPDPIFQVGYYNGYPKIGIRSDVYLDGTLNARAIVAGTITGILIKADEIITDHIRAGNVTTISYNAGYYYNTILTAGYGNVLFIVAVRLSSGMYDMGGMFWPQATITIYRDGYVIKQVTVKGTVSYNSNGRYYGGFPYSSITVSGVDYLAGYGGYHTYSVGVTDIDTSQTSVTYDTILLMEQKR